LRRHATGTDRARPRARRPRRGGRDGHDDRGRAGPRPSKYLKLRPWHRREVELPLYALQTDLTGGRVLRGARRFIAGSRIPRALSVLVDASSDESHLDPLAAAPARNEFLRTVVPFLRKLRGSAP
jgi:hypothetical protein